MELTKRSFLHGAAALMTSPAFAAAAADEWAVPGDLQAAMSQRATALVLRNIRGGGNNPIYRKPFLDAAFSGSIFLWDTCFMAAFAKYDLANLPIANALDNFYALQEADGYICREYTGDGQPFWPKEHPVSINPPLLGWAELELFGQSGDRARLARVYPALRAFHAFITTHYRQSDGLFFSDAFGSGMDNITRYPPGWTDDGLGIALTNLHPELFVYDGLSPKWNRQGRSVDMSAQMALFSENLAAIAALIGRHDEARTYRRHHARIGAAVNRLCWSDADGFYHDLAYGRQLPRRHIGMFWTMMAGIVPRRRLPAMLAHLTDPGQFWTRFPIASTPTDDPDYSLIGSYWRGSVWAPTNYMIIRGLTRVGEHGLARRLARQYYWCVAQVFKETGTFWENYAPAALTKGSEARSDFCGWTALVPLAIGREYIGES